jgi:sulfotransferase family protein
MSNPYVFIVGCPRSGTTLLQRIVDAHPQIAIPPHETHWIPRFFEERRGVTDGGLVTEELIPVMLSEPRFNRMGVSREQLARLIEQGGPISYSTFVTKIFELYGQARGKPLVGDKTPAYVRRIGTLHALWPNARFVHLIRDGRDVCLSFMSWSKAEKIMGSFSTWKADPISTAALKWEVCVQCGRQAGRALGPELYHEMRYEYLVARPEKECSILCGFLGIPYDDAILRFHEGRTRPASGRDAKHAWLPITSGLRDWRTEMAAEDVGRFEAVAGGLLDELGYERAVPHPRPESLEVAAKIRELLAADPKWKKHSIPSYAKAVAEKVVA